MRCCSGYVLLIVGCTACLESPDVVARARPDPTDATAGDAGPPVILTLTGDLEVHDPAIAGAGPRFWIYSTGPGIPVRTSSDLLSWSLLEPVFQINPAWIATEVPDASDLWSPDVIPFGGVHHLYYAVSTFGSGRSCIGHAISPSLEGGGAWADQGAVICSNTTDVVDDWNAIDPSALLDADATPWLAFGSYRSGIKLIRLDPSGARADQELHALAARPGGDAIQAVALARRGGSYYLFMSFDACCQGADSTHRLMVGRAAAITGPYTDRSGQALLEGGGTQVLGGDLRWRGPGSNDLFELDGTIYNVYHAYDADNGGRATLRIATVTWDAEGWPISAGP